MDGMLKSLMSQFVMLSLSGAVGGWVSVQVTLAEVRAELHYVGKHVEELTALADKYEVVRARVTRLEVMMEQRKVE